MIATFSNIIWHDLLYPHLNYLYCVTSVISMIMVMACLTIFRPHTWITKKWIKIVVKIMNAKTMSIRVILQPMKIIKCTTALTLMTSRMTVNIMLVLFSELTSFTVKLTIAPAWGKITVTPIIRWLRSMVQSWVKKSH